MTSDIFTINLASSDIQMDLLKTRNGYPNRARNNRINQPLRKTISEKTNLLRICAVQWFRNHRLLVLPWETAVAKTP